MREAAAELDRYPGIAKHYSPFVRPGKTGPSALPSGCPILVRPPQWRFSARFRKRQGGLYARGKCLSRWSAWAGGFRARVWQIEGQLDRLPSELLAHLPLEFVECLARRCHADNQP